MMVGKPIELVRDISDLILTSSLTMRDMTLTRMADMIKSRENLRVTLVSSSHRNLRLRPFLWSRALSASMF